jgi:hypothetical protein
VGGRVRPIGFLSPAGELKLAGSPELKLGYYIYVCVYVVYVCVYVVVFGQASGATGTAAKPL